MAKNAKKKRATRSNRENRPTQTPRPLAVFDKLEQLTGAVKREIANGDFGFREESGGVWKSDLLGTARDLVKELRRLREDQRLGQLIDETNVYRLKYLKGLTWCAECFDYFGQAGSRSPETPADLIEKEVTSIRQKLDQSRPVTDLEREVAREEMWVLLHHSRAWYRRHKFDQALGELELAEAFVQQRLANPNSFPCRLTLATLWCTHAHVLRQQARLDEAISLYERAIYHIREVLGVGSDRRRIRVLMETGRALGLGLGWILYTRGSLNDARAMLAAGLVCLDQTNDRVHKAYAELLLGCIQRAEAGFDVDGLSRAIAATEDAHQQLLDLNHKPYLARANYQMALAYLYRAISYEKRYAIHAGETDHAFGADKDRARADFHEAEKHLRVLENYAGPVSNPRDPRWLSNAFVVRSRLERDRGRFFALNVQAVEQAKRARRCAEDALKLATDNHQTSCEVDALIALAESKLGISGGAGIENDLAHAITGAKGNPKVIGVCQLHLTRFYVRRRDLASAESSFRAWEKYRDRIQHGLIHHVAREIEAELKALKAECLIIDSKESLRVCEHAKNLLQFLITRAELKYPGNHAQQARELEIPPATYEGHLKKMEDSGDVKVILQVKKPERRKPRGKAAGAA